MIGIKTTTRFNTSTLKRKTDEASFRSLGHAGAAIRLTARRSIRRRKKPSRPGSPPHTQTGRLKRSIRYEVNKSMPDVVIGPVNEIAGRLWHLHEHGGIAKIPWDESLKVEEHWDFFWRAKIAGMHVGVDLQHSFKHEHVDPPGYRRRRPEFLEVGLKKHGLKKVVWR